MDLPSSPAYNSNGLRDSSMRSHGPISNYRFLVVAAALLAAQSMYGLVTDSLKGCLLSGPCAQFRKSGL